jgi:multiple sugar transport system permease protein
MNREEPIIAMESPLRRGFPDLLRRLSRHAVLIIGSIIMLIPFIWMISTSFKVPTEIIIWPPQILPKSPTWMNYLTVFKTIPILRYLFNSFFIASISTIFVIATSVVAGYIFAKFPFWGSNVLFILVLATAIVPLESYIVPFYLQMIDLNWVNTYQGIIAPFAIMSFGIFLMRQHIRSSIPDEYIDAARIDGASEWNIFRRIIIPLSTSAMGALGIFAFIQAWGAFLWPLLMANDQRIFNMELGLTAFQFKFSVEYGPLMAGSVLNILPMIIAFIFLRRQIIESIALSGLKA